MSLLTTDVVRRSCAFVIELDLYLKTMEALMHFFSERRIIVDALQMQLTRQMGAILIVHTQIEKDRIRHTVNLMEKMPGIIRLEWFESKGIV